LTQFDCRTFTIRPKTANDQGDLGELAIHSGVVVAVLAKGQLISKCPFGVFKYPKKPTKFL
jgi:hypothetical protein